MNINNIKEIPTPRTDDMVNAITKQGVDWHFSGVKMAEFSRQLERELATEHAAREETGKAYQTVKDWGRAESAEAKLKEHSEDTKMLNWLEKIKAKLHWSSGYLTSGQSFCIPVVNNKSADTLRQAITNAMSAERKD